MLRTFVFVFFFLTTASHIWGQDITKVSARLQGRLSSAEPTEQFDISILLSDRVAIQKLDQQLYTQRASIGFRARTVIAALKNKAAETQVSLMDYLESDTGVNTGTIRSFWVTNVIFCTASAEVIERIALRPDVDVIDLNVELLLDDFEIGTGVSTKKSVGGHEPGHDAIKAPEMWAMGYSGYGRKVMSLDTGVDPYHSAISSHFDGYYHSLSQSWYVLGRQPEMPTDCNGHGTHTVGIMCGLDTINNDTIGVAWGARWIGSPNLCGGGPSMGRSIAGFQWAMDPDGDSTTIDDMPDVINNSWRDPNTVDECTGLYKLTFDAVEAVGIAIVFSAGNNGSGTSTITQPKNINTDVVNVFCVANINGNSSTFPVNTSSSRGPSTCGGTGSLSIKPEVSAPGTNVRSCYQGDFSELTGTSMAAPHVAGAIVLLKEPFPYLTGAQLKLALYNSCVDLGNAGEDNTYGMGLIDVPAAYNYLLALGNIPVSPPANDASAIHVLGISDYSCDSTAVLSIVIENRGIFPLVSSTVLYSFKQEDTLVVQWTGTLSPMDTAHVAIPAYNLSQGTHEFSAVLTLPNGVDDERPFNDKIRRTIEIPEFANVAPGYVCVEGQAVVTATNSGSTAVQWFAQATASPAIGIGPTYTTPTLTTNTVFYSDVYNTAYLGKTDSAGSGAWNSSASRYLVFDCFNPFTLVSVKVYADEAGTKRIELRDDQGTIIDSATVSIPLGESRVTLNFDVYPGTNLQLGISGPVDLFRNDRKVLYPYSVPGLLSIKTSDQGPQYYYYFFDWEVDHWSPCGRIPVPVYINQPITANLSYSPPIFNLLKDDKVKFQDNTAGAASWEWNFGDGTVSELQNPSHTYSGLPGIVNVGFYVADTGKACRDSIEFQYEVIAGAEDAVFPNPSTGRFLIDLGLNQSEEIAVSMHDAVGKRLMEGWSFRIEDAFLKVDLSALSDGAYIITVSFKDKRFAERLLKLSD